jgi:hypothetical protein
MILNTQAVLLAFVAVLRLVCSVLVLGLAAFGWWAHTRPVATEEQTAREDRGYLVFLLILLVVALNLVSWPLLYLLLQSYVSEWPGLMCIYGVTQVGTDSLGTSRFLPDLLQMLQLTKPGLVFAGGAWFVLYLLNRRTRTAPLAGRLLLVLLPLGALGAADAAAELAYIAIPKKEVFPSGGCCTSTAGDPERFLPPVLLTESGRTLLAAAYYGSNVGLILGLLAATRPGGRPPGSLGLLLLSAAGLAVLVVSGLFLIEVAAPTLLRLPYHHCPYDLIPQVPEAVVAIALFLGGCFLLGGQGGTLVWRCPETAPFLSGVVPPAAVEPLELPGVPGHAVAGACPVMKPTSSPG